MDSNRDLQANGSLQGISVVIPNEERGESELVQKMPNAITTVYSVSKQ